jgi:hypothetical protein
VIKRARHNVYQVKQPRHIGVRHAGPPTIDLVNLRPPEPNRSHRMINLS